MSIEFPSSPHGPDKYSGEGDEENINPQVPDRSPAGELAKRILRDKQDERADDNWSTRAYNWSKGDLEEGGDDDKETASVSSDSSSETGSVYSSDDEGELVVSFDGITFDDDEEDDDISVVARPEFNLSVELEALNSMEKPERVNDVDKRVTSLISAYTGNDNYHLDLAKVKNTIVLIENLEIDPPAKKTELLLKAFEKMDLHLNESNLKAHVDLVTAEHKFLEELGDSASLTPSAGADRNVVFCMQEGEGMVGVFKPQTNRFYKESGIAQAASHLGDMGSRFPAMIPTVLPQVQFRALEEATFYNIEDGNIVEDVALYGESGSVDVVNARGLMQEPVKGLCPDKEIFKLENQKELEEALDDKSLRDVCMLSVMFGLRDQKLSTNMNESNFLFKQVSDEPRKLEVMLFDLDVMPVGYVDRSELSREEIEEHLDAGMIDYEEGEDIESLRNKLPASATNGLMGLEKAQNKMSLSDCKALAERTLEQLTHQGQALEAMRKLEIPLGFASANIGDELEVYEGSDNGSVEEEEAEPVGATTRHSIGDDIKESEDGKSIHVYSDKQIKAIEKRMNRVKEFMENFLAAESSGEAEAFSLFDVMTHVCPDYGTDFEVLREKYSNDLVGVANMVGESSHDHLTRLRDR